MVKTTAELKPSQALHLHKLMEKDEDELRKDYAAYGAELNEFTSFEQFRNYIYDLRRWINSTTDTLERIKRLLMDKYAQTIISEKEINENLNLIQYYIDVLEGREQLTYGLRGSLTVLFENLRKYLPT